MKPLIRTINPADIVFSNDDATPVAKPLAAPLDIEAVEHSVWQMLAHCGVTNQNERVIMAIIALIESGVNTGPRIIAAAKGLGFAQAHVGAILGKSRGANPLRHQWHRDESGVYHVHAVANPEHATVA